MQKYSKPKFKADSLGINPYIQELQIHVNKVVYTDKYKRDEDVLVNVEAELEMDPYVKVYTTPENRAAVASLTPRGKELYFWIMYEIKPGQDFVWINKDFFLEQNNTSLNTLKEAIKDLVRYTCISYTVVRDVYWINPKYFFKGNRIAKYPKNIKLH